MHPQSLGLSRGHFYFAQRGHYHFAASVEVANEKTSVRRRRARPYRDDAAAVTPVAWRATNPGRNSIDRHFSLEGHLPDPGDFEQVVDHGNWYVTTVRPVNFCSQTKRGSRRRVYCRLHCRVRVHVRVEGKKHRIRENRSSALMKSARQRSSSIDNCLPR